MTLDELKKSKRWFLWNYSKKDNTGKLTKVPMSADGGKTGTNSEYEHTWVTYEEAFQAHEKLNSSGLGFVVPDDMYFLYIDGKDLTNSLVQLFIARHETYAEISPSGNGLHFLGLCEYSHLPLAWDEKKKRITVAREFYQKNPHNHIELYFGHATNRFATFTGNAINDLDLMEGTNACLTTLDKDMRRKAKVNYSAKRDGGT